MHSGRAWASDTITAYQGDRLLSRGLVLLNTVEPDLMRHSPTMPDVPGPRRGDAQPVDHRVPRRRDRARRRARRGERRRVAGHVLLDAPPRVVRLRRGQPGDDRVVPARLHHRPGDAPAHRTSTSPTRTATISTGVISHTAHFHDHADVGQWLLVAQEASYAGNGRVFGSGAVFTQDGTLVSTFAQDSMARGVEGTIDPKRGM